jgi:hypothetical protein
MMFNSWMFYIILGLSASTIGLGWLSLSLHDDKVIAEQALVVAINVNSGMQKSLNLKGLSCKIDASSGAELVAEKNKIDEGISPVNSQLKELATVKKTPSKAVTVVAPKQNETIKDESNFLPDDGLLSPNVTGLLRNGWCSVYPDSGQCLSTGQSPSKSL